MAGINMPSDLSLNDCGCGSGDECYCEDEMGLNIYDRFADAHNEGLAASMSRTSREKSRKELGGIFGV